MPLSYYTLTQWSLLFYLYGFLGWVWESCYVSLCRRQWVNRGFLHGPMLPIYGFGALMILLATLPVRQNLALVFLLGTASATLLEYVTGAAMERIFHVRYWDYSHQRFQVKGYICLRSSIAWGFFSILLVRVLHPPLEDAVLALPTLAAQILSLGLTVCFGADVGASAREAFDLKELLEKAAENNASLASLEAQLQQLSDAAESRSEAFREGMRAWQLRLKEQAEALRWQSDANRAAGRQYLAEQLEALQQKKTDALARLEERLRLLAADSASASRIEELRRRLARLEADAAAWKERRGRRALALLRRNPTAVLGKKRRAALRDEEEEKKEPSSPGRET